MKKPVKTLLFLVFFVLLPSVIFSQSRNGLQRAATSTITTRKESDGSVTAIITNRRFTFTSYYPDNVEPQDRTLLLLEEFKSERNLSAEGQKSSVSVQAWSGRGADPSRPLWKLKSEGDEGTVEDRFYKVTKHGCCGAEDTFIFFSTLTGRKVFTSTSGLFQIEVPNTPLLRLVAYQSMMASIPAPENKSAKKVIGLLEYGSEKELLQKLVIRSRAKKLEDTGTPKIKMLYRQKLEPENRLMLWGADKKNDPSSLSDFSIVLSFDEGQDVVIPVKNDHLDLKSARLPKGLILEAPARSR